MTLLCLPWFIDGKCHILIIDNNLVEFEKRHAQQSGEVESLVLPEYFVHVHGVEMNANTFAIGSQCVFTHCIAFGHASGSHKTTIFIGHGERIVVLLAGIQKVDAGSGVQYKICCFTIERQAFDVHYAPMFLYGQNDLAEGYCVR